MTVQTHVDGVRHITSQIKGHLVKECGLIMSMSEPNGRRIDRVKERLTGQNNRINERLTGQNNRINERLIEQIKNLQNNRIKQRRIEQLKD